jgi:hypothetical protein
MFRSPLAPPRSALPLATKGTQELRRGIEAESKAGGKMKMQMKRMKHETRLDLLCISNKGANGRILMKKREENGPKGRKNAKNEKKMQ